MQEIYRIYLRESNSFGFTDDQQLELIKDHFQKEFPGNYHIQEAYLPEAGGWGAKIIFDTPEDETWFKLKYG